MAFWDDVIPESDRRVFATAGFAREDGLGRRPALVVIDMTYAFIGDRREPVLESVRRWPNSAGEFGWRALPHIADVINTARSSRVPVFYTRGEFAPDASDAGSWQRKLGRGFNMPSDSAVHGDDFVREVAPKAGDIVIKKEKPSAFFGTPLISRLNEADIDTVIVMGCTTSGCVRATVVDAFSYNFHVGVVAEGVFDRGEVSHKVSLFDMKQKYADILNAEEARAYIIACGNAA